MLSKNFTLKELVATRRKGIDNTPNEEERNNLVMLAQKVLQPLRDAYNNPIMISSGFRCNALNKAVGGVPTSQHLKGEAADINNGRAENQKIFNLARQLIKDGKLKVGQLIDERNYSWVHISLPNKKHNNQILHL